MTATPDEIIAGLKDVVDAQYGVNVELREQLQEAQAEVVRWREQAVAFEEMCQAEERQRGRFLRIPWSIYDEIARSLENGDAHHALRLIEREAQS